MSVSASDLAHWREWIGRRERRPEGPLDAEVARRYAATLGEDVDVSRQLPSLAHWAYFLAAARPDEIGEDGHPRRGGFLPPITLPRRMFAAADITFHQSLRLGIAAEQVSSIASVEHKAGKSGELVFVEVVKEVMQADMLCVREKQTIVFRGIGEALPSVSQTAPGGEDRWTPSPVDLFRFSAATFNSHRIHYDAVYAREVENYPALVVHGPFVAAKLFGRARAGLGRDPTHFVFKALAPVFVAQPIGFEYEAQERSVRAVRCDGVIAMTATFE